MMTRRELFRGAATVAGGAALARLYPEWLTAYAQQPAAAPPADPLAAMRAGMAATPIQRVQMTNNLALLMGPGGNVVVLAGPEGKVVVDSFVQGAFAKLREHTSLSGKGPITLLIDTHWHFDHTDNNAAFRMAGAQILAHENTKKRMSEPHDLLGMHFNPSPADALPTQTFTATHSLDANGETIELAYVPPAHTDTDIAVHYVKANVIHMGDVFFNGMYPFFDAGTGGSINGMINGAEWGLKMANNQTKIVPGHGPLGNKAALTRYRDVLVTVRDRVEKMKKAGRKVEDVVAAKPTAEFDATWGKGFMMPNDFVTIVYNTL
jgi:glyoxylase-like metal-dependent hydrolase (beta-lactamase superfamily II)